MIGIGGILVVSEQATKSIGAVFAAVLIGSVCWTAPRTLYAAWSAGLF